MSGSLGLSSAVEMKLICASNKEGRQIGKNGVASIRSQKSAKAGVDQWRLQNKAVMELFERHPPLEVAFVELAQEVIRTAPWGLMWRVGTGAAIGVVDR